MDHPTPTTPLAVAECPRVPTAPFRGLSTLWIQITGTWCNLECTHCINASGPATPWLKPLDPAAVRRAIAEAEAQGVKEIYFTGGEPFLHRAILPLLAESLEAAPTTVLTNGTLIDERLADRLALLADGSRYSLELRVSLDDPDPVANDRIRGRGAWVTATEIVPLEGTVPASGMYGRFREFLHSLGVEKPRVKIMPVFPAGRLEARGRDRLTDEALEGFDRGRLQCAEARAVAAGGIYACPILAGLKGARLSTGSLADACRPASLYHPACVTCHATGTSCRNY
jgi:hypothetical protein